MNKKEYLKIIPSKNIPLHYSLIEANPVNKCLTYLEYVNEYFANSYVNTFYKPNSHITMKQTYDK
jgi:hypothetical protein